MRILTVYFESVPIDSLPNQCYSNLIQVLLSLFKFKIKIFQAPAAVFRSRCIRSLGHHMELGLETIGLI